MVGKQQQVNQLAGVSLPKCFLYGENSSKEQKNVVKQNRIWNKRIT